MDDAINFAKAQKKGKEIIASMKELTYKKFEKLFDEEDPAWFSSGRTGLD